MSRVRHTFLVLLLAFLFALPAPAQVQIGKPKFGFFGGGPGRLDAIGNASCYTYDALHRPLTIAYAVQSPTVATPTKTFVYDSATISGNAMQYTLTYDALDRTVEQTVGSISSEVVYGPGGGKLALMNGTTLTKAFVPLQAVPRQSTIVAVWPITVIPITLEVRVFLLLRRKLSTLILPTRRSVNPTPATAQSIRASQVRTKTRLQAFMISFIANTIPIKGVGRLQTHLASLQLTRLIRSLGIVTPTYGIDPCGSET